MLRLGLAGVLGGALVLSGAVAQADTDTLDGKLEKRVESSYGDAKLSGLDVDVKDGVVTLSGEVATTAERARAERLARNAGARRVVNKLEIDTDKTAARIDERAEAKKEVIDQRAERQKEAVDRQAEAAKDRLDNRPAARAVDDRKVDVERRDGRVGTTADRTRSGDPDRTRTTDPWITTKVKSKILAEDILDKSEINVDTTNNGVVTLRGTVPSAAAETRALELARTTEGVRAVVDKLDAPAPVVERDRNKVADPWITTKVKTKILADDLLDKSEINVDTTNDGVVTLKGSVPSMAAENRALELARTTEGVRSVVDQLDVKAPIRR